MIKTIIIEDESIASELLEEMLKEIEPEITVVEKCIDLPSAVKSIKMYSPDLVFLDVELPVYNGLQLLEFLHPDEISFGIIFTTASNQHALRAFDMSAVDYVLKPIRFEKLKNAVQKFKEKRGIENNYPYSTLRDNYFNIAEKKIVIPQANGFEIMRIKDILFIKAEGSYAKIYRQEAPPLLVSHNLKYFEAMLFGEKNFIRIHRSYLVNIQFAKRISRNDGAVLVMENNLELPVINEKLEAILNYFKLQQ